MRKSLKLLTVLMLAVISSIVFGCTNVVPKINSVTLKYDGKDIPGKVLEANLSQGEITIAAEVDKTGEIDGAVTFDSSNTAVATISTEGKVALLGGGQTVITATSAANELKSDSVTLTVTDDVTGYYNISVVDGSADKTKAVAGTLITLTYNAAATGYEFDRWSAEPEVTFTGNTFTMPAAGITVTAHYRLKTYTITEESCTYSGTPQMGETITLTYDAPESGHEFDHWSSVPVVTFTGNSFTMPASDITVTANYRALSRYALYVGGEPTGNTYLAGETVTLTPEPEPGMELVRWQVAAGLSGNDAIITGNTFTMPANAVYLEGFYAPVSNLGASLNFVGSVSAANPTPAGDYKVTKGANAGGGDAFTVSYTSMSAYGYNKICANVPDGIENIDGFTTFSFTVTNNTNNRVDIGVNLYSAVLSGSDVPAPGTRLEEKYFFEAVAASAGSIETITFKYRGEVKSIAFYIDSITDSAKTNGSITLSNFCFSDYVEPEEVDPTDKGIVEGTWDTGGLTITPIGNVAEDGAAYTVTIPEGGQYGKWPKFNITNSGSRTTIYVKIVNTGAINANLLVKYKDDNGEQDWGYPNVLSGAPWSQSKLFTGEIQQIILSNNAVIGAGDSMVFEIYFSFVPFETNSDAVEGSWTDDSALTIAPIIGTPGAYTVTIPVSTGGYSQYPKFNINNPQNLLYVKIVNTGSTAASLMVCFYENGTKVGADDDYPTIAISESKSYAKSYAGSINKIELTNQNEVTGSDIVFEIYFSFAPFED